MIIIHDESIIIIVVALIMFRSQYHYSGNHYSFVITSSMVSVIDKGANILITYYTLLNNHLFFQTRFLLVHQVYD